MVVEVIVEPLLEESGTFRGFLSILARIRIAAAVETPRPPGGLESISIRSAAMPSARSPSRTASTLAS